MRGATECARRLRKLFATLRSKLGKVQRPQVGDPVSQLILGVFSRDLPESKAREALQRLRGMVVDYNELRVVASMELANAIGDVPDVRLKCEDVSRALNKIFAIEHVVSLDDLRGRPRKEIVAFLDEIDGLEAYTRARIRLLGLEQHAIPLDEAMWSYARETQIVHPRCTLHEAQQFLERQLPEDQALDFVALFRKQAWGEKGAAVRRGEVERIRSVPPDRTSRNMLQLIVPAGVDDEPDVEPAEVPPAETDEPKRAARPARTAPKRAKTARTTKKTAGGGRKVKAKVSAKKRASARGSSSSKTKTTARKTSAKRTRKAKARSA